jgi:tetratricopeptide (TPR) repeat protein/CHAT domain-containing protein
VLFRLGRNEEALRAFEQAEALARKVGDDGTRVNALKCRSDVLFRVGRNEEALRVFEGAEAPTRVAHDDLTSANALKCLGDVLFRHGRNEGALRAFEEAEVLARKVGDDLTHANIAQSCGEVLFRLGRNEEALQAFEQADALAKIVGDDGTRANTLLSRGDVLFLVGRNEDALRAFEESEALAQKIGDDGTRANAVQNRGTVLFRLGHNEEALRAFEEAEVLARKVGYVLGCVNAVDNRGDVLFLLGRNEEALRAFEEAEALAQRIGSDGARANAVQSRGSVLFRLGRNEEALRVFEDAEVLARKVGSDLTRANAVQSRGSVLFRLGRNEEALRVFEDAEALTRKIGYDLGCSNAVKGLGDVLFQLGRNEEALRAFEEAEALARNVGYDLGRANAVQRRGDVLFFLGRNEEALRAFEEAEALARNVGADLTRANAVQRRGDVLFRMALSTRDGVAFERAESLMDEAVALHHAHGEMGNVIDAYQIHATALQQFGQPARAVELAITAFREIDTLRTLDASLLTRSAVGDSYGELVRVLVAVHHSLGDTRAAVHAYETRRGWTFEAAHRERTSLAALHDPIARLTSGPFVLLAWQLTDSTDHLTCLFCSPSVAPTHLTFAATCDALVKPLATLLSWQSSGTLSEQSDAAWNTLLTSLAAPLLESAITAAHTLDNTPALALHGRTLSSLLASHPDLELRIVPSEILQLVPWAALPCGTARLIEHHPIVLGPTLARVLAYESPNPTGSALVLGNPDKTLPFADWEALTLAERLRPHFTTIAHHHSGNPLTADAYRTHTTHYSLHHLSTHALMSLASPADSVIVFSASSDGDRTVCRLPELLSQRFDGATIVFSACTTGIGDLRNRFDLVSFSSAYLSCGASRVLGTLWSVDDYSTALLMVHVYENVFTHKLSWSRAVQRAQIDMLRANISSRKLPAGVSLPRDASRASEKPPRTMSGGDAIVEEITFTSPYHWAALQLHGR